MISGAQKGKMQNALHDDYPVAFPLHHMDKDFRLVANLAGDLAVPMPALAASREMTLTERAKGVDEDFSAVIRLMEELSGIQ